MESFQIMRNITPIITYHYFCSEKYSCADIKREDDMFIVNEINFYKHMKFLHDQGYVTDNFIEEKKSSDHKRCIITFDDGHVCNYTIAYPILKKYSLKGMFFISPGKINRENYMTWGQLSEMVDHGMQVGSHTYNHIPLLNLAEEKIKIELSDSKKVIEDKLGIAVKSIALPMGYFNKHTLDAILKYGYKYIYTSKPGYNIKENYQMIERVMIKKKHRTTDLRKMIEFNYMNLLKYCFFNTTVANIKKIIPRSMYSKIRHVIIGGQMR